MKFLHIGVALLLGLLVYYHYFANSYEKPLLKNNTITIRTDDLNAEFDITGEFNERYVLFGGGYFKGKNLINPITLAGLPLADAKNMYALYPDFYRCTSPGAQKAKDLVQELNLIPADKKVLEELKLSITEFEDNFANNGDRVCVSLIGKRLKTSAVRAVENGVDIKEKLPLYNFYFIESADRVNCKALLSAK